MRPPQRTARLTAALVTLVLFGGCAGGPAAFDKAMLAKPEMAMSWNVLQSKYDQHIYDSKEGAAGGYGVGGGGCGCY
jgi:hypothetical protein